MSKICKQDNYKVRIEKLFLHNTGYVTFHVFFSSFVNSLGFGFSRAGVQGPASVRPRSRLSGPRTKPDQIRKFGHGPPDGPLISDTKNLHTK